MAFVSPIPWRGNSLMPARPTLLLAALLAGLASGCGGGSTGPTPNPQTLPTPSVACASTTPLQLAVGQHLIIDPASSRGCLRLPPADANGAKYLMVLASTTPVRSSSGVQGPYLLRASSPGGVAAGPSEDAGAAAAPGQTSGRVSVAAAFDAALREREREALAEARARGGLVAAPPIAGAAPTLGEIKSFKVCTNLQCSAFGNVAATARFVGQHVAIFLDNTVPTASPLQDEDLTELGVAFDTFHYGIDTTAFGRESDIDGNGVVLILMTDAVNDLTPDCTNGRVIGYFYGGDLLGGVNSNNTEIFYTLVPAPQTAQCAAATRRQVVENLKPTLIHEFQHMISFNQHALIRGGSAEETWLNEAMSHYAEELGGRLIPNSECAPTFTSCRSQYTGGDILNAYDYLRDTEAHFLIYPTASSGSLEERGSAWLFLRWTLDQYAVDTILAAATTRALVATTLVGVANIAAVTGGSFATMVPEWLLAIFLDDGTDLPEEPTGRLRYKSWGLRSIWTNLLNQSVFPAGFPIPVDVIHGSYIRSGTLRGGSGRHFMISQTALGAAIDLQVLRNTAGNALDPALAGRFGIVRIQ